MGVELYWDNDEQTVMLCEFAGKWTWEELFSTLGTVKKITDKADYEIAAIVDVRSGMNFPGGSLLSAEGMEQAKRLLKMGNEGTGPIVIVGANSVIRTVYNTVAGMNRRAISNITFADSVKEARQHLHQRALSHSAAV